jgi:hypothetical protein
MNLDKENQPNHTGIPPSLSFGITDNFAADFREVVELFPWKMQELAPFGVVCLRVTGLGFWG